MNVYSRKESNSLNRSQYFIRFIQIVYNIHLAEVKWGGLECRPLSIYFNCKQLFFLKLTKSAMVSSYGLPTIYTDANGFYTRRLETILVGYIWS